MLYASAGLCGNVDIAIAVATKAAIEMVVAATYIGSAYIAAAVAIPRTDIDTAGCVIFAELNTSRAVKLCEPNALPLTCSYACINAFQAAFSSRSCSRQSKRQTCLRKIFVPRCLFSALYHEAPVSNLYCTF